MTFFWSFITYWQVSNCFCISDADLKTDGFSIESCRSMVAVMDVSFNCSYPRTHFRTLSTLSIVEFIWKTCYIVGACFHFCRNPPAVNANNEGWYSFSTVSPALHEHKDFENTPWANTATQSGHCRLVVSSLLSLVVFFRVTAQANWDFMNSNISGTI